MVGTDGNYSKVIGEPPGNDVVGLHLGNPRVESEAGEHHAEGAALRDAARLSAGGDQVHH